MFVYFIKDKNSKGNMHLALSQFCKRVDGSKGARKQIFDHLLVRRRVFIEPHKMRQACLRVAGRVTERISLILCIRTMDPGTESKQ